MDKQIFKKSKEELIQYLAFKRKHHIVNNKKEKVLIIEKISIKRVIKNNGDKNSSKLRRTPIIYKLCRCDITVE